MPLTITLPQLRDSLRRLEANVSADELWCALNQRDLPIPAPSGWAEQPSKADTLAPCSAMRDEALASQTCGPMQQVKVESPEFCVTGSRFVQPLGRLQDGFHGVECGSLDAPGYIPRGSVYTGQQSGPTVFADISEARA